MDRLRDPTISIVLVLVIGVLCGVIAQTLFRRSWITERLIGLGRNRLTFALVGIAGAFIGFHAAMLATASTVSPLAPYAAAIGAASLILWGWQKAPS